MRKQAERLSTLSKVKSPTSGNTTLGLPFPIHSSEVLPTISQLKCQIHVLPSHSPLLLQYLIVCHPDTTNSRLHDFLLPVFFALSLT